MPLRHWILRDQSLALIEYHGVLTASEVIADFAAYRRNALFRPGLPELADLSRLTDVDLDYSQMRRLVSHVNRTYSASKTRTLISFFAPEDVPFGMARMFEMVADGQSGVRAQVHRSEADALAYLGRRETSLAAIREQIGK